MHGQSRRRRSPRCRGGPDQKAETPESAAAESGARSVPPRRLPATRRYLSIACLRKWQQARQGLDRVRRRVVVDDWCAAPTGEGPVGAHWSGAVTAGGLQQLDQRKAGEQHSDDADDTPPGGEHGLLEPDACLFDPEPGAGGDQQPAEDDPSERLGNDFAAATLPGLGGSLGGPAIPTGAEPNIEPGNERRHIRLNSQSSAGMISKA